MELWIDLEAGRSSLRLAEDLDCFKIVAKAGAVSDPAHALAHHLSHHHLGQLTESGEVAVNSEAVSFLAAGTVGADWPDRWQMAVQKTGEIPLERPQACVLARVEWS
ncbi:MAG: hypothetical protein WCO31_00725 [Actinomycetes bacterium]